MSISGGEGWKHGEVVPTWDYAVTHVHGAARAVEDADWLRAMLDRLVQAREATQAAPWQVADAPPSYIARLLRAIVGIEIPIDRLEGRLKASQDEAMPDRHGTVAGLQGLGSDEAHAMARLVQKAIDDEGAPGR